MKRIFVLIICLLFYSQSAWSAEPIKIGVISPLTGDYANVGKAVKHGIELMAADINKKGGILKRKVILIYEDDRGTPQFAQAAGRRLRQQGVIAVIGSYASDITESLQSIFDEAKIVQISYGSTAVPLTERGFKYFFRTCPRDDQQAKAAIKVIEKMKIKKVAIIHDNSLYGKGLAEALKTRLRDNYVEMVFYDALLPNQPDYIPLLEKVKAEAPEMVLFAGYYPEAAKLLRDRKKLNMSAIFMGGDAVNHVSLVSLAGKNAAEGFYFMSPPNPVDIDIPQALKFLSRFEKVYNYKPSSIDVLLACDAFTSIVQSIRQIKTTDPVLIADYLRTKYINKKGLTGVINFDQKGDVVHDLHAIYYVDSNGQFVLQRLIQYGGIIK